MIECIDRAIMSLTPLQTRSVLVWPLLRIYEGCESYYLRVEVHELDMTNELRAQSGERIIKEKREAGSLNHSSSASF